MIVGTVQLGVLGLALQVTTLCLIVALLAATWRLLAGPTLADRVVALDLVSMLLVVFLVLFAMISGIGAYIYAAIALALIGFLGTVAFAHYIDRTRGDSDE
jgi:multicomponent Na+:H+ antiporter subunit F